MVVVSVNMRYGTKFMATSIVIVIALPTIPTVATLQPIATCAIDIRNVYRCTVRILLWCIHTIHEMMTQRQKLELDYRIEEIQIRHIQMFEHKSVFNMAKVTMGLVFRLYMLRRLICHSHFCIWPTQIWICTHASNMLCIHTAWMRRSYFWFGDKKECLIFTRVWIIWYKMYTS